MALSLLRSKIHFIKPHRFLRSYKNWPQRGSKFIFPEKFSRSEEPANFPPMYWFAPRYLSAKPKEISRSQPAKTLAEHHQQQQMSREPKYSAPPPARIPEPKRPAQTPKPKRPVTKEESQPSEPTLPRWRLISIAVLLGSCTVATISCGKFERIPYTGRFHFVLADWVEKRYGDYLAEHSEIMKEVKGNRLPSSDPRVVRVEAITTRLIQAVSAGLMLETGCKVNNNDGHGHDAAILLEESSGGAARKGEIAIFRSPKQSRKLIWRPHIKHLDGKNWEIYVVDTPEVNASCFIGGKIFVYRGLLRQLKSDEELATVIAHEIGHFVARHSAERLFRAAWEIAFMLTLDLATIISSAKELGTLVSLVESFISRRREAEADYVGLLIMASAGYDPHVAPTVYKDRLGDSEDGFDLRATHPSGDKRARLLKRKKVMGRALAVYKEVKAGKGVRSFV